MYQRIRIWIISGAMFTAPIQTQSLFSHTYGLLLNASSKKNLFFIALFFKVNAISLKIDACIESNVTYSKYLFKKCEGFYEYSTLPPSKRNLWSTGGLRIVRSYAVVGALGYCTSGI